MRLTLKIFLMQAALAAIAAGQQPEGASIQGHVSIRESGNLAGGVRVSLQETSFGMRRRVGKIDTDERFDKLAKGVYTLSVEQPGFLPEYVRQFEPGQDVTVRLGRSATIRGRVSGADGNGIAKAVVEVAVASYAYGEISLQPRGFAYTDDRGNYRITGIAPGRYYLRTSCRGYDTVIYPNAPGLAGARKLELREGGEMEGNRLRLARRKTILARRSAGGLRQWRDGPSEFLRAYPADMIGGTFVDGTMRDGGFQLDGLKSGRCFLQFEWVGPTNNVTRSAVIPVAIGKEDQHGVVLRAAHTTISGRLETGGHPLPCCLTVFLEPTEAAIRAHVGGNGGDSVVASDGSFKIANVPAGEYWVRVHSGEAEHFFVREQILHVDGPATPITGIHVGLDFSAGAVSGRALVPEGSSSAVVVLQSIDREKLANDTYQHVHGIMRDASYSITNVVPGDYLLFAWREGSEVIGDPDLFERALRLARRITVLPRGSITADAPELLSVESQQR